MKWATEPTDRRACATNHKPPNEAQGGETARLNNAAVKPDVDDLPALGGQTCYPKHPRSRLLFRFEHVFNFVYILFK